MLVTVADLRDMVSNGQRAFVSALGIEVSRVKMLFSRHHKNLWNGLPSHCLVLVCFGCTLMTQHETTKMSACNLSTGLEKLDFDKMILK